MSAPFPNLYTHRKVAEASSKSCDICYKQTVSVLITPDKKDRHFCLPKIDEAAVAAKKREKELNEEKERLKKEYEEKQRKKKEKEKDEKDDKDKVKDKDKDDTSDAKTKDDNKDNKAEDDKKEDEPEEEARVFELKTTFYNARLQKRRQIEAAKRDRERVKQPGYFPSVPSEPPSK